MALLAFIGGLSAATAMVIVESVAVSIMVSNDIVVPLILRARGIGTVLGEDASRKDMGRLLLRSRRFAIFGVLLLAYLYYHTAGEAQLASIGLLSFAAVAQFGPAFFGGLFWQGATARGAIAGLAIGVAVWAYTLLLPSFVAAGMLDRTILDLGLFGIQDLSPQALFGIDAAPLTHGVFWSLGLNVLAFIGVSLMTSATPIERMQASVFVRSESAPMAPGFRLWRSSVTVGELIATVARYLGEERTRRSFESFAQTRRLSLAPASEADIHLLRYAEHILASAIGGASSRLVLSLLLRKGAVSPKAALKLLDDASAAIQYNREILQSALDHVRQGIAVFDKDLQLICWNREFGEMFDLPPDLVRVGVGLDQILRRTAERGDFGPGPVEHLVADRIERYTTRTESFLERLPMRGIVVEARSNPMPDGGFVVTYTDITPTVEAAEALERANENLERRVHERTEELTRLNQALARAKSEADEANISKTRFLAAASHDILQPLNAARLYATSLVERKSMGEDAKLAGNIDASLEAVEEILGALLDISRLDTGAMKPEISSFAIDEILSQLEVEFAPLAAREGAQAHLRAVLARGADRPAAAAPAAAEPRLQCDQIHAQGTRAGRLPPAARPRPHRGLRHRARHPDLEAEDRVQGIPAPRPGRQGGARPRPRSFDRGTHRPHSRSQDRPALGARKRLDTSPWKCRSRPRSPARPPHGPRRQSRRRRSRALSCSASTTSRRCWPAWRRCCRDWGTHVLGAPDLEAALAVIKKSGVRPDVLLIDYHLDEGNGIEAIVRLRQDFGADLPAALITADRSPQVREDARTIDVLVLNKPVKPAALRAFLAQWRIARPAAE